LLTFTRDSFTAEPVVTEFLTGLGDPWDVVWVDGSIFVSERTSHRIVEYDATTGALIRIVVEGAALATVSENRFVVPLAALSTIRAEDVVAPEGLFYQDDWLYYGSRAMQEVRRVHLTTGEIQVVCRPIIDTNSLYIKIALSDGTFGPRGTVFTFTFSNARFGFPQAFLPNTGPAGTVWGFHSHLPHLSRGKGGRSNSIGYPTAGGVGLGRLYCGSTEEGLVRLSKSLPEDPTPNEARYNNGVLEWFRRGYRLVYGDSGFGYQGMDLPWGVHDDIDYLLTWNGHVEP
jgi:hypothetical protein